MNRDVAGRLFRSGCSIANEDKHNIHLLLPVSRTVVSFLTHRGSAELKLGDD